MYFQDPLAAKTAAVTSAPAKPRNYASASLRRSYNYGHYPRLGYGYPQTEYVISSACQRREKLRIFVSDARMQQAERYGLTLFIRGQSGDDRTLSLTPNYVIGYRMATYRLAQQPAPVLSPGG